MSNDMARLVSPMLSNCLELYFIDPHFGPENPRHRRPLEAFLNEMAVNRCGKPLPNCIEIHTSNKAESGFFKDTCHKRLPQLVPSSYRVRLKRWVERPDGEKFHQRFILTDIGGVEVDPGLDDGKEGESFKVMLLKRKMFDTEGDHIAAPAFDLAENPVEIIGEA